MIKVVEHGERLNLNTPIKLPNASAFLWNKSMMIHMNCRGYAVSQFMQPEPAKYAHAPNLEAKTFMQPEQPYYQHHPGRFFYVKDEDTGNFFSVPYEPVRKQADRYCFSAGKSDIIWEIEQDNLSIHVSLSLAKDKPLELWSFRITNRGLKKRNLSIYTYFPTGYMSWMNQSGAYHKELQGVVCSSITPYQKYKEYDHIKTLKDKTFLIGDTEPFSWEANQHSFEGDGGLQEPSALLKPALAKGDARYETPACILQYRETMEVSATKTYRFIFGPAKDEQEIKAIKASFFESSQSEGLDGFPKEKTRFAAYVNEGRGPLQIETPDPVFDNFVNHWLPRQVYYHGETNRLSTDPQTRNYLQDNMGMSYIKPVVARNAFLTALRQQETSGAMPDGILIHENASLKYINQVPHTDHCVWLPICIRAYLDETNDYSLLQEKIPFSEGNEIATVAEHLHRAMQWLLKNRDHRGLNYINQGDWCDPMNMVGPEGKGVSGWLTLATAYAIKVWMEICIDHNDLQHVSKYKTAVTELNAAVNTHLWDGNWYARGITDKGVVFGVHTDIEGQIFLNPQGWALLSKAADEVKQEKMIAAVSEKLDTPYGVEMLGPAFTKMREDVGRVTQKHPGSAENGSVYNHAAAFYIYGLYASDKNNVAYELLRKMIPGPENDDLVQRGQLPVFIPNYYRGAYKTIPRTAGRSSQLFNTGTVPWVYRCLLDGLFGLQGTVDGLRIHPKLPKKWNKVKVDRRFRGSNYCISIERKPKIAKIEVVVEGKRIAGNTIPKMKPGLYNIEVWIPMETIV